MGKKLFKTRPKAVRTMGRKYRIKYVNKPSEVDIQKRKSLWGQIDFWSRTIRVYDAKETPNKKVWHTLFHELIHGLASDLCLKKLEDEDAHDDLDVLALALVDLLDRNGWVR